MAHDQTATISAWADLGAIVLTAAERRAVAADSKGVILALGTPARPLPVLNEGLDLCDAVSGLIESAIAVSGPGDIVTITAEDRRLALSVAVADAGPGSPTRYELPPPGSIARSIERAKVVAQRRGGQLREICEAGQTVFTLSLPYPLQPPQSD